MSNGICKRCGGCRDRNLTGTSLKAALDLDWDPQARNGTVYNVQTLNSVESWVKQKTDLDDKTTKHVNKSIEDARQIEAQDVERQWMVPQSSVRCCQG